MKAKARRRPAVWVGGLIGGLLTLPLIAILFVGERLAGLPFLPFDFFDWFARILPGPLITAGIDTMIEVILALGLGSDLDSTAKLAERFIALSMFVIIGIFAGALFFAIMNRLAADGRRTGAGVFFGWIVGLPLALISFDINISATADPFLRILWFIAVFATWGSALYWAYERLATSVPVSEDATASAEVIDRRQFLIRLGGATAAITVVGAGLGAVLGREFGTSAPTSTGEETATALNLTDGAGNPLPNANASVMPAPGTRPEYTPVSQHYRIDILSGGLPSIDADTYALPITGLVENPVEWTLADIEEMPSVSAFITMSCISNRIAGSLIGTTKWTGVPMQHILDQIQPTEEAQALRITGADGFDEFVSLDLIREDERIMLCYAWDDEPLPLKNGFPLRIHIPDRYGMKQPKWINGIEVVESHEPGYWVRRGWSAEARVKATSVIDTVASDAIYEENGQMLVPIGGIAWAGDRGVSKVEISIDEGPWQEAQLREPLSQRTWVIWRYDWPFADGQHTFEVRMVEEDGTPQIEEQTGVRPDGATGLHSVRETLSAPEPETETAS